MCIITFSFLYWELDSGGPESPGTASSPGTPRFRLSRTAQLPVARPGWRPEFFDYLYLGFTNATAFSPTDVMPLSRWAKLAMAVRQ